MSKVQSKGPAERSRSASIRSLVERHPIGVVFVTALVCRLVVLMVDVLVLPDSWIALDDAGYSMLAEQMANGGVAAWSPSAQVLYGSVATFLVPLTALYWLFGPIELLGQVLVALVGAGAAALTTKLAREDLGTRWAVGAGLIVAFLPSQIAWSVAILKDAWVWSITAALGLAAAIAFRSRGRVLWLLILGAVVLLFLLGHLRLQSTFVAAWALVVSALLVPRERRSIWFGGALAIAVLVPWLAGGGPGGIDPVLARASDFGQARAAGAAGADSAIVAAPPTYPTAPVPSEPPDSRPPGEPDGDMDGLGAGVLADLAHLPRGLSVMLFEPYPWDANRNSRVVFAKLDTLLWYPILGLALVGLSQVRRHRRVLLFPTLVGIGVLIGYALSEGNLGTAFRHRGELVWIAAVLAAFGAKELWDRSQARRATAAA